METGPGKDRLRLLRRLKEAKVRRELGLQLLEGQRLVQEALAARAVTELFVRDEQTKAAFGASQVPVHVLGAAGLERLAQVRTPQAVVAVGPLPEFHEPASLLDRCKRLLLLDGVQDPGNVGALARTALALGLKGLMLLGPCADPTAPKVLRASAGALFHLPLARLSSHEELLAALQSHAHQIIVPVVRGGQDLRQIEPPPTFILALGNEGSGTSLPLDSGQVLPLTIPMAPASESLNVTAAAAAILGRWLR